MPLLENMLNISKLYHSYRIPRFSLKNSELYTQLLYPSPHSLTARGFGTALKFLIGFGQRPASKRFLVHTELKMMTFYMGFCWILKGNFRIFFALDVYSPNTILGSEPHMLLSELHILSGG